MAPRTRARAAAAAAPTHASESDPDSGSDSDAPEAVSLAQSKKHIAQLDTQRTAAARVARETQKAANRERDRRLHERAARNREGAGAVVADVEGGKGTGIGKGKGRVEAADELEERMARAMAEAEAEEGADGSDDGEEYEEFGGIKLSDGNAADDDDDEEEDSGSEEGESADNSDGSEEDEGEEEEEEAPLPKSTKINFNPDHLPDELFAAAFAPKPKRKPETEPQVEPSNPPAKKRRATGPKDIVVGSRAIRTLPSSDKPSVPATLPSKKIEKFLDRTLALSGGSQPGKGWERRPANIGVLRRNGPALNFVRNT